MNDLIQALERGMRDFAAMAIEVEIGKEPPSRMVDVAIEMAKEDSPIGRMRSALSRYRSSVEGVELPVGAVLVNRDTREGVMFYSSDMIPDPNTIKDCFELVEVYTATTVRTLIAQEREECAKVCESLFDLEDDSMDEAERCAAAIRARGNK